MAIKIKKVKKEDLEIALKILSEAREHQRELGFMQWEDDYPNTQDVLNDINDNNAYFFLKNDNIFGYAYIGFEGDVNYKNIEGEWKSDRPYAVIHRLAFEKEAQGKGFSKETFGAIKKFVSCRDIHSIRIDTHKDNKKMQHILLREGYMYCGIVTLPIGPRLGYELLYE